MWNNPDRSFGAHFVIILAGEKTGIEGWWVYYTAPFVGAILAVLVCKYVFALSFEDEKKEEPKKAGQEMPVEVQALKCKEPDL